MLKYRKLIRDSTARNGPSPNAAAVIQFGAGTVLKAFDDPTMPDNLFFKTRYGDISVYVRSSDSVPASAEALPDEKIVRGEPPPVEAEAKRIGGRHPAFVAVLGILPLVNLFAFWFWWQLKPVEKALVALLWGLAYSGFTFVALSGQATTRFDSQGNLITVSEGRDISYWYALMIATLSIMFLLLLIGFIRFVFQRGKAFTSR